MPGMMKDMMQEAKPDDGSRGMMSGMHGTMGIMMKLMEQRNAMMKSSEGSEEFKEMPGK